MNTFYVIEGQKLHIKCGLFFSETIEIASIKRITPSRLMMSAPAVSLDRLEILYNKFDSVLISPKDKEGFVNQLKKTNPTIEARLQWISWISSEGSSHKAINRLDATSIFVSVNDPNGGFLSEGAGVF